MKLQGLSEKEATERLEKYGPNLIQTRKIERWYSDLKSLVTDPMGVMLLILSILYFLMGQNQEALILLFAFIPVVGVDVFLNLHAKKALTALGKSFLPSSKVIRDSKIVVVDSTKIVPDDILVFEEGQIFCADGTIQEAEALNVDESSISGESLPVLKAAGDQFYSGTIILSGRGLGTVSLTGQNSRFGKIANLMESTEASQSPLKKRMDSLVKKLFLVAGALIVLLFFMEYFRGNSFGHSLISAITFGMAAVPEEFAIVYTLYLSLGAWRLSRKGVLIRSLPSVEALGSVDILCTDKTGTLTQGLFCLEKIIPVGSASEKEIIIESLLACESIAIDTLEKSIVEKSINLISKKEIDEFKASWTLIHDYPFELEGKHMSHVWKHKDQTQILCMKGAFEGIIEHCNNSHEEIEKFRQKVNEVASQGHRVIALAIKKDQFTGERDKDEEGAQLRALLVFSDPIRAEARSAIEKCQKAGIEVKMITGDHLQTAHAVAEEVGLDHDDNYIYSGEKLSLLKSNLKRDAYIKGNIFARVLPEQKYELVQTLKSTNKLVAMTGDGINDAPALRLADIGISMGPRASDLTRSQAEIALIKDDFYGLVEALFEGRKIFQNLKKSFSYLLFFHVPVILLTLVPSLLGWPTILFPVHLVLLELIVHPVSAFVFENMNSDKAYDLNARPNKNLLSKSDVYLTLGTGLSVSILCLLIFSNFMNEDHELARSLSFFTLMIGGMLSIILEILPKHKVLDLSNWLSVRAIVSILSIIALCIMIYSIPHLQNIFHVRPFSPKLALGCISLLVLSIFWRPFLNSRSR